MKSESGETTAKLLFLFSLIYLQILNSASSNSFVPENIYFIYKI